MIVVLIMAIVIIIIALEISSEYAFKRAFLKHKKTKEDAFKVLRERGMLDEDIYKEVEFKNVNIKSKEGLNLQGYLIEEFKNSNKYIVLVHGYSANHHIHVPFVRLFIKLGFNILLIDMRNHGRSEGEYPTYGFNESDDLDRWINFLESRRPKEKLVIGLHGQSMGGATVLLCGCRNPKVKFIIDDCGYTEGREIIKYQFGKVRWVPFTPIYKVLNHKVKKRCRFKFEEVSPRNVALKSKTPILFIHGDLDKSVPVKMSIDLYNERQNDDDELLIIKGAGHLTAYKFDTKKYEECVEKFISRNI